MLTALPQLVPLPAAPLRDRQAPGPEPDPSDSSPDPGKLPPALPLPDAIPSGRPALAASCPCRLEELDYGALSAVSNDASVFMKADSRPPLPLSCDFYDDNIPSESAHQHGLRALRCAWNSVHMANE